MKPWREALHREDGWSRRLLSPVWWIIVVAVLTLVLGAVVMPGIQRLKVPSHIVVYTSQDKVYAEELIKLFTAETGLEVRAVYDSEAVKAVGIANRLLAEKNRPRCDVFWNNEEIRTRQLAREGVFDETTGWSAFGYRSRRLVINTNLVAPWDAPRNFTELTNSIWRGKFAMAYPLFGTTATHFLALRSLATEADWREWCRALAANEPMIVDGNSVVVRQVGRGEVALGMTDIDDIVAGQREGYPIAALLVPNTVGLIRGGPNPEGGRQFIEWLTRPETLQRLVTINAIEGVDAREVEVETLKPDWARMLAELEPATEELKRVFLR
jgi:iron(III) transport system substrate-binding protein